MNGLTSIDAVYIALVFIVPGYVFTVLRSHLVAGRRSSGPDFFVSLFTVSAVNFALFGWTIYLAIAWDVGPMPRVALWTCVVLVFPAFLGLVCGACTQRDVVRRIYNRLGLKPLHVVPTAWDYKFSTASEGEWVYVILKDGTKYGGWWAGSSFASSEPGERDLLIEHVFDVSEEGPWQPRNRSLLVAAGEIRSIEFIHKQGVQNGQADDTAYNSDSDDQRRLPDHQEGLSAIERP